MIIEPAVEPIAYDFYNSIVNSLPQTDGNDGITLRNYCIWTMRRYQIPEGVLYSYN
jgi:hypothetical protein